MSLNIHAHWRISFNNPIATIPLGTDFLLVASYHDNIGNVFHAGPTDLKVRTSRLIYSFHLLKLIGNFKVISGVI